jgi:hypothetical protein
MIADVVIIGVAIKILAGAARSMRSVPRLPAGEHGANRAGARQSMLYMGVRRLA